MIFMLEFGELYPLNQQTPIRHYFIHDFGRLPVLERKRNNDKLSFEKKFYISSPNLPHVEERLAKPRRSTRKTNRSKCKYSAEQGCSHSTYCTPPRHPGLTNTPISRPFYWATKRWSQSRPAEVSSERSFAPARTPLWFECHGQASTVIVPGKFRR